MKNSPLVADTADPNCARVELVTEGEIFNSTWTRTRMVKVCRLILEGRPPKTGREQPFPQGRRDPGFSLGRLFGSDQKRDIGPGCKSRCSDL